MNIGKAFMQSTLADMLLYGNITCCL